MIKLLFFTGLFITALGACDDESYAAVKAKITEVAKTDERRWNARLLRAAFHDCIPKSCDGSLRFELKRSENKRISKTVNMLNRARRRTCVSLADALKLGLEVSMELSGGPQVSCPLGTEDVSSANPTNQLADRGDSLDKILGTFTSKGFNKRLAVAGIVGGHSLGFDKGKKQFTPTPDVCDNGFAVFLKKFGQGERPDGFFAMKSDKLLAKTTETKNLIVKLANNKNRFNKDFRRFLTKMCKM